MTSNNVSAPYQITGQRNQPIYTSIEKFHLCMNICQEIFGSSAVLIVKEG